MGLTVQGKGVGIEGLSLSVSLFPSSILHIQRIIIFEMNRKMDGRKDGPERERERERERE